MKRIPHMIAAGLLLLFAGGEPSHAQLADVEHLNNVSAARPLGIEPVASPAGLLDWSKVRFDHSYSIGYASGGGQSISQGMWRSTMYYDFSPQLSLALNVGVLHNTGSLFNTSINTGKSTILPGATLDWRPNAKTQVRISFQTYNGLASPSYYGRGYNGLVSPAWIEY